jgi:transposase
VLWVGYVHKDDLKHLREFRYLSIARRFWDQWYARAIRIQIEPPLRFAVRLKPYLAGILTHCRYRLHASLLEGIDNTITVIKRRAYRFRNCAYFFLKIRDAFPGIGR